MQTTTITINNNSLTIAVYDDKSSAAFIKKQKSRSREVQKKTYRKLKAAKQNETSFYKRPKTRVRSVEMYDEDVYAEDDYADDGLERIDWETLVYNTETFHRTFYQTQADTLNRYEALCLYERIVADVCPEFAAHAIKEDDFDQTNEELLSRAKESPYHQEMLDLYAGIVANVATPVVAVPVQYTCCVGCRNSNGRRPFYSCERYDEVFCKNEDEDDGEELLDLYNQMLDDMERGDV